MQSHLIRTCCNSGWCYEPLLETVALESRPLFRVLRHRMSSPPIYLFEVIHKPFALSRVFLLSSRGESVILVKKKAPSRSVFSASMHVVLKASNENPKVNARRFKNHVHRSSLSTMRPLLLLVLIGRYPTTVSSFSFAETNHQQVVLPCDVHL